MRRRPVYVSTKIVKEYSHEGIEGEELARVGQYL